MLACYDSKTWSVKKDGVFKLGKIISLSVNPTKWANTQTIFRLLPPNCLSMFDRFVGSVLKGLIQGLSD